MRDVNTRFDTTIALIGLLIRHEKTYLVRTNPPKIIVYMPDFVV